METASLFDEHPGRRELPTDWQFDDEEEAEFSPELDVFDGLMLCLEKLHRVDIAYIAARTGLTTSLVIKELADTIWQNPATWEEDEEKGWETSDQYLSGALLPKLTSAKEAAAKWPERFERNVRALTAVMPKPISLENIHSPLGAPWIPPEVINAFIAHLFTAKVSKDEWDWAQYNSFCGQWSVTPPSNLRSTFRNTRAVRHIYGTSALNAFRLLERTLNHLQIKDPLLQEKQQNLIKKFEDWIANSPEKQMVLQQSYEQKFGFQRKRSFDGSFLRFPGKSPDITLYRHQRDAVARILLSGNTLLAHSVGSGKTYIMIAAAMELKRTGRSPKNLFIVPNNLVGQWKDSCLRLYPNANILTVEPINFTPKHYLETLERIKTQDCDAIVMAFSCADRVPISQPVQLKRVKEELEVATELRYQADYGRIERLLGHRCASLMKQYEALQNEEIKTPEELCFDNLGITALFLDEAHNYKNIPLTTTLGYVRGINAKGSSKCAAMLAKAQYIQKEKGIVVLATGTPLANSITDVYVLQQYLQPDTLRFFGLESFDAWSANFAEIQEVFEVDVDGSRFHSVERFVQFHNLTELSAMFGMVADFAAGENNTDLPRCPAREDCLIRKTPAFTAYMQTLSTRADKVRNGGVPLVDDNLLRITSDGRKASLDLRLVDESAEKNEGKSASCAQMVFKIWKEYAATKRTQLIFCDLSTPKKGFNVYDKLRDLLLDYGIPSEQIAYIHDNDSPKKREALYRRMRQGDVRIIIGSTFKLGLGVNVQQKLLALHHLDAPWRPADMEQREGRILRQGNENEEVHIFRYVMEGSFDAFCWQILENKQRFIANFLSGTLVPKSCEELDATVLSYAEIKGLALGNPLMRERVECSTEIEHILLLRRRRLTELEKMRLNLLHAQEREVQSHKDLANLQVDLRTTKDNPFQASESERIQLGNQLLAYLAKSTLEEIPIASFYGLTIVLPARLRRERPALWLVGQGRYYQAVPLDAIECIQKLENLVKDFPRRIRNLRETIASLQQQKDDLKAELAEPDPYEESLQTLKKKLLDIDKKLNAENPENQ
ncbi:MAG: DEAD/DEAH box helicase family protein [Desulfovibrionaceae bacterium]|nr:DEAD/DEAH box helicase family protein [Desulfovibrionaceae bacterium]